MWFPKVRETTDLPDEVLGSPGPGVASCGTGAAAAAARPLRGDCLQMKTRVDLALPSGGGPETS